MCPGAASILYPPSSTETTDCGVQDMKLLDFTGRKVDPSLLMGSMKESKKEQDPNIKVRPLTAAPLARWHAGTLARWHAPCADLPRLRAVRVGGAPHAAEHAQEGETRAAARTRA